MEKYIPVEEKEGSLPWKLLLPAKIIKHHWLGGGGAQKTAAFVGQWNEQYYVSSEVLGSSSGIPENVALPFWSQWREFASNYWPILSLFLKSIQEVCGTRLWNSMVGFKGMKSHNIISYHLKPLAMNDILKSCQAK